MFRCRAASCSQHTSLCFHYSIVAFFRNVPRNRLRLPCLEIVVRRTCNTDDLFSCFAPLCVGIGELLLDRDLSPILFVM